MGMNKCIKLNSHQFWVSSNENFITTFTIKLTTFLDMQKNSKRHQFDIKHLIFFGRIRISLIKKELRRSLH